MNQPRIDFTRMGLPKDILQVVARLKARGLVKFPPAGPPVDIGRMRKTPQVPCERCGVLRSEVYGSHRCKVGVFSPASLRNKKRFAL